MAEVLMPRQDTANAAQAATAAAARAAADEIASIRSAGGFVCDVAHIRAAMRAPERFVRKD